MPDRLQQALTDLQTRFGSAAPRPAGPTCPARATGIPALDDLTGIGGWPVGRLSLLAGPRGSGKRTLAQQSVAAATREGTTVYVDFLARLDPEFLAGFGAALDQLLVVRPRTLREGMETARVLARAGADLVCLDLPPRTDAALEAALPHLLHRAADAATTLLLVHDAEPDDVVRYYASLIVSVRRRSWIVRPDGDLEGVELEAVVVKNRLAPPGRQASWVLAYPS